MEKENDKTNAMRILDRNSIAYRIGRYEYDENDLNGMHAAEGIGADPLTVFKTLVTRGQSKNYYVFCIPVCCELNLKKAAKSVNEKNVEMIHVKELLSITGYIRGGCSPLGMKKQFSTIIDESASMWDEIAVSGGKRGLQIFINPTDLCNVINAKFEDIVY